MLILLLQRAYLQCLPCHSLVARYRWGSAHSALTCLGSCIPLKCPLIKAYSPKPLSRFGPYPKIDAKHRSTVLYCIMY